MSARRRYITPNAGMVFASSARQARIMNMRAEEKQEAQDREEKRQDRNNIAYRKMMKSYYESLPPPLTEEQRENITKNLLAEKQEALNIFNEKIHPALKPVYQKMVEMGLEQDVSSAEKRFVSPSHLRGAEELAREIAENPAGFHDRMEASLKKLLEYKALPETIRSIMEKEIQTAISQNLLPNREVGEQFLERILDRTSYGLAEFSKDADSASKADIDIWTGDILSSGVANSNFLLENPDFISRSARSLISHENGKIITTVDCARALVEVTERQDRLNSSADEKRTALEKMEAGGFIGRLISHFDRATLRTEMKSLEETSNECASDIKSLRGQFERHSQDLVPALRQDDKPAAFLNMTGHVIRAAPS